MSYSFVYSTRDIIDNTYSLNIDFINDNGAMER